MSMPCNDVRDWLKRDFDGNAEPSGEVMEHVESCEECRALARRNQELARAAREALPTARVPFDFEDRVMEALAEPADEAALDAAVRPPRRFPRFAAAALVAVALLLLWPRDKAGDEEVESLTEGGEAKAAAHFVVRLSDRGKLSYDGDAISLDGLAMLLKRHEPKSVLVRGDAGARWQHVQWILTVCAQERIADTHFAVGDGAARDARLPKDLGLQKDRRIRIRVGIKATNQHFLGNAVTYRVADRDVADGGQVAEWIRAAKAAAGEVREQVCGEIEAGHDVPFQRVCETMDRFRAAGIRDVLFHGTQVPDEKTRRRTSLPLPGRAAQVKVDPVVAADVEAEAGKRRMAELAPRAELPARYAQVLKQHDLIAELVRQRPDDKDLQRSYGRVRKDLKVAQKRLKKLGPAPGLPGRPGGAWPQVQVVDADPAVKRQADLARRATDLQNSIEAYAARRAQLEALRKQMKEAERTTAMNPGNRELLDRLAAIRRELAAAEADNLKTEQLISRLQRELRAQEAAIDAARPVAGVTDRPFHGPKTGRKQARRAPAPKDAAGWIELLRKRAEEAHSMFQDARTRDDKDGLARATKQLDETRDLLDVAADLKALEKKRATPGVTDEDSGLIDEEIARLHAKLRTALPPAPKPVEGWRRQASGRVLSVKADRVMISIGSNDGVRLGDRYVVIRGAQFVGRITIGSVAAQASMGEVDEKLKGPAAPIKTGDVAKPEQARAR
jgi:biopolymer transport protein ExbD